MKDNLVFVGIGEALWDVLPTGKKVGGAPANFAFHASQFGGVEAYAISALGKDALGDELESELKKSGLGLILPRVDFPTGTVQVTLDAAGVPTYEICTGVAWDNIPYTPEMEELAKRTSVVCFGSLAQRNPVSRETINRFVDAMPKDEDVLKIFDINLRQLFYDKEVIASSLRMANVLKLNDDEIVIIQDLLGYGDAGIEKTCRALIRDYGLRMVILTSGAKHSQVFTETEESFVPTPKCDVVDTVGAGDSFTGSFAAGIIKGLPIGKAHEMAVNVAGYVCTQPGAMPVYPEGFLTI